MQSFIVNFGKKQPSFVAQLYALRKQPAAMFDWLERARIEEVFGFGGLLYDAFYIPYHHDPRFAALCKRADLPVPGEALSAEPGSVQSAPPITPDPAATRPRIRRNSGICNASTLVTNPQLSRQDQRPNPEWPSLRSGDKQMSKAKRYIR